MSDDVTQFRVREISGSFAVCVSYRTNHHEARSIAEEDLPDVAFEVDSIVEYRELDDGFEVRYCSDETAAYREWKQKRKTELRSRIPDTPTQFGENEVREC